MQRKKNQLINIDDNLLLKNDNKKIIKKRHYY